MTVRQARIGTRLLLLRSPNESWNSIAVSFPSPYQSITIKDYLLAFHGAEGVGSDCPAHLSDA